MLILVSCADCGRMYGAEYEADPPALADLECACGSTQFEEIRRS